MKEKIMLYYAEHKAIVIGAGVAVVALIVFLVGKKKGWFGKRKIGRR